MLDIIENPVREAKRQILRSAFYRYALWAKQEMTPVIIPDEPHMEPQEARVFAGLLRNSKIYLEYGSGGSTVLADRLNVPHIVSIESDGRFASKLQEQFNQELRRRHVDVIHVPIGLVGKWGKPIDQRRTEKNAARWQNYADRPWEIFREHAKVPDFILIDGRFRVNCTLTSLLELPDQSDTWFLFDDYFTQGRNYRAIEPFIEIRQQVDRGVVFLKARDFDAQACERVRQDYVFDCE